MSSIYILSFIIISFLIFFTGKVDIISPRWSQLKIRVMIAYAYAFTFIALALCTVPFFILDFNQIQREEKPLGIVRGCVDRTSAESLPKELLCEPGGVQKARYSWLVNIGGGIHNLDKHIQTAGEGDEKVKGVVITGGIVIPLYVVVLALMGAAVSMTRRVPEYQQAIWSKSSPKNQINDQVIPEPQSYARVRSLLVFQIMQVFSAPLIAVTAYYIISPQGIAASVVIAFISGFASETILLTLRRLSDAIIKGIGAAEVGGSSIDRINGIDSGTEKNQ